MENLVTWKLSIKEKAKRAGGGLHSTEAAGLKKTQCARVNTERQLCYTEVSEGDV